MSTTLATVFVATRIKNFAEEIKNRIPELRVRETEYSRTGILSETDLKSLNESAEVVVADGPIVAKIIKTSKTLKWAEVANAGLKCVTEAIEYAKHPDFKLTTSGGRRKGGSFAEYLVGQIIAWERGFLKMHEDQKSKIWNQLNWVPRRMLDVMTIGILDDGEVSSEVKSFCKALGMKVLSFPATVEKTNIVDLNRQTQELVNILQNCDFVCNLLPNAPETRGLLSRDIFKQCKRKPVFINIGGEDITDANTILTAIRNKWISGAILDAHPGQSTKDSEFSTLPNVIFTYHASGAGNYKSVIDYFIDNFNKYVNGQQLNNLVPMHNR